MNRLESCLRDTQFAYQRLLEQGRKHWFVMLSGGKDSTTVAITALEFALSLPHFAPTLHIVHIDTLVENPALLAHVSSLRDSLLHRAQQGGVSLSFHSLSPPLEKRFFYQMLAKGLPPPNPKLRWCTRTMKLEPARAFIRSHADPQHSAVLVGLRFGESDARDQRLNASCARGAECGHGSILALDRTHSLHVAAPIASWRTCDVWDFLDFEAPSRGYKTEQLHQLYKDADLARFGCWTCTLVRYDRSMQHLISQPRYAHLAPLFWFRERLAHLQHDLEAQNRDSQGRRVGLSLETRKSLFAELLLLEKLTGLTLLQDQERAAIEAALTVGVSPPSPPTFTSELAPSEVGGGRR